MLRITAIRDGEQAKKYFRESFARADYYTGSEHVVGLWFGKLAGTLGVTGPVVAGDFRHLCDNRHPSTGDKLTPRSRADRRVGYDFSFSCPKSVTLAYLIGNDARILDAFREAVRVTMTRLEAEAATRVRTGGRDSDRKTGQLLWSEFIHTTSRPINGVSDPQLHAHCFVFNLTHDPVEGRLKALQVSPIKTMAWYYEGEFLSELAARIEGLGYAVESKGRFWEIAGCPAGLIDKFSNRTRQIEERTARENIRDPAEKATYGARTRESKRGALAGEQLEQVWRARLDAADVEWLSSARTSSRERKPPASPSARTPSKPTARAERSSPESDTRHPGEDRPHSERGIHPRSVDDAVRFSLAKLFERAAVLPEALVVDDVLRTSPGRFAADDVWAAMKVNGVVRRSVNGQTLITTEGVLREEERMVALVSAGRGKFPTLGGHFSEREGLAAEEVRAGERILQSRDFVTTLVGKAGAGKTTLIKSVIAGMRQAGQPSPVMLAPTTKAARIVLREEGHTDAETVAKFLADEKLQRQARGGVIWVDEAPLLGTADALRLFEVANLLGARLVLSGDDQQNRSVGRGSLIQTLRDYAGVEPARLDTIHRQRGPLRDAVQRFADGDAVGGLHALREIGGIRESGGDHVYRDAARSYVDAVEPRSRDRKGRRMPAFLFVPTHKEIERTTDEVRDEMRKRKLLGRGRKFRVLFPVDGTKAERSRAGFYQPGQVIQFHQNSIGFKAGSRWKVMASDVLGVVLVRNGAQVLPLPLSRHERFEVYEPRTIEVAPGDMIRITRNGRTKSVAETAVDKAFGPGRAPNRDLLNGSTHRVKRITRNGGLHLDNGLYVPGDYGHFTHGYAGTALTAQGITCDHAICCATAASGRAIGPRQLYVGVSRGRDRATIFTDSFERLVKAAQRDDLDGPAMSLDPSYDRPVRTQRDHHYDKSRRGSRGRSGPDLEL